MLFGYPIDATVDNWLHECFGEVIRSIHQSLENNLTINEWTEVIPSRYRNRLKNRLTGRGELGNKLNDYQTALSRLTLTEQNRVLQAFEEQNQIASLLSCQCDCESITDLPEIIHDSVKALFKYAFEILSDRTLEIRDKHYSIIYKSIPARTCPFCGDESFSSLGTNRREDLDHYLLKDAYPFAAANLLNLVPMGSKCNSRYKHTANLLYKSDKTRRRAFDPYNHEKVTVSLCNSQPFSGGNGELKEPLPKWEIEFGSTSENIADWDEKTDTWNDVFHVRNRYSNILNDEFKSWFEIFCQWCKRRHDPQSDLDLVDAIKQYADERESEGFGQMAFLKAALFRMLHTHCQQNNQRLIKFIRFYVDLSA